MTGIREALVAFACVALAVGMPARAAVITSVNAVNTYGQWHATSAPTLKTGSRTEQLTNPGTWCSDQSCTTVTNRAESGIDYEGWADSGGSFFFLHNDYCVGTCFTKTRTEISFTVLNDSDDTAYLRFDSLITPGHLARFGNGDGEAGFTFEVKQSDAEVLYHASGNVSANNIGVTTRDGSVFTDLRRVDTAVGTVLDWSGTSLNLLLRPLAARQSTTITYVAEYHATASGNVCLDLRVCAGYQVVFGDPRQNGGGMNMMAAASLFDEISLFGETTDAALGEEPVRDLINQNYIQYASSFQIVDKTAAKLPAPDKMPQLNYGNGFTPQGGTPLPLVASVPEPATWAIMLAGTGLVGGMLRRRRGGGGSLHREVAAA